MLVKSPPGQASLTGPGNASGGRMIAGVGADAGHPGRFAPRQRCPRPFLLCHPCRTEDNALRRPTVGPPPHPMHRRSRWPPTTGSAGLLLLDGTASLFTTDQLVTFGSILMFSAVWWYVERQRKLSRLSPTPREKLVANPDESIVYERDRSGRVVLSHGGASNLQMGAWDPANPLDYGLEYFRSQVAVSLTTGPHQRVLVLGLGIGAIPSTLRAVRPEVEIDVVEIDRVVIEGAREYANLKEDDHLHVHEADAAEFVTRPELRGRYDLVILDCFDPSGVPAAFHEKTFYEEALKCMKPDGVFSMNVIWTLPEALPIRSHLQQLLASPLAIYCQTENNCAVFGRISEPPLDPLRMATTARAVDAREELPYLIAPQVERISAMWP
eukprot:GGOE01042156.1.p1 GENE.GGOE01042156.1~~GGOE01042156.1.p1  ORF type:complete len:383 (-),score=87.12 GGOE01042156.1:111-1259(-)